MFFYRSWLISGGSDSQPDYLQNLVSPFEYAKWIYLALLIATILTCCCLNFAFIMSFLNQTIIKALLIYDQNIIVVCFYYISYRITISIGFLINAPALFFSSTTIFFFIGVIGMINFIAVSMQLSILVLIIDYYIGTRKR